MEVTIKGKTYKLASIDRELGDLYLTWADTVLPKPLDVIVESIGKFPKDLQESLVKEAFAAARCKRNLNDPEVQKLINSPSGASKMIHLIFGKHDQELTEDQTWDIFQAGINEHGDDYMQNVFKTAKVQKE